MKIGLYFGSFNPIHIGHLIVAQHVLDNTEIDKLWFVVSPQNPFKPSKTLLNEYDRLDLVKLAIEDNFRMETCDIEFKLPKPSYTVDTLAYLKEKYPTYDFSVIMGSDSYQNLDKWKNATLLLDQYNFIVYPRPGFEVDPKNEKTTILEGTPSLEISASLIRNNIKSRKSVRYLLTEKVSNEIERQGYFLYLN
ncbi:MULTISPECIES: nicotinate (nicotinamide) nucleotide adenylyltransferase [Chitinophagaceae]